MPINSYQPYYTPNGYQPVNYQPQTQNNGNSIIWCQGEAGAKSYLVAAGQSVLLMDSEQNRFYIKSTDNSGMPMPLRIFDYTEKTVQTSNNTNTASTPTDFVSRDEFNAFKEDISKMIGQKPVRGSKSSEDISK